jgi:hypothetical protein
MTFFLKSPRHFPTNFASRLRSNSKSVTPQEQATPWRGFQISRDLSASREQSHSSAQKPSILDDLLPALQRIQATQDAMNNQMFDPISRFQQYRIPSNLTASQTD